MNILVLGAGLQGCAAAFDLLQVPSVTRVTLADLNPGRLPKFLQKDWGGRLKPLTLDVKDPAAVKEAMTGMQAVLSALNATVKRYVAEMDESQKNVDAAAGLASDRFRTIQYGFLLFVA